MELVCEGLLDLVAKRNFAGVDYCIVETFNIGSMKFPRELRFAF
jgi:hypothetical protein